MDIDDIKFNELLSEKRYKEVLGTLKGLLSKSGEDRVAQIVAAIDKQTASVERLVAVMGELPKPTEQTASIIVNQEEVVTSLNQMTANILQGLSDLKDALQLPEHPKEWEFKFKRNYGGFIDSIQAKQLK